MKTYKYAIILHPSSEGGYWISVPSLRGCYSQGSSLTEAIENAKEAIALCIEDLVAHGEPVPEETEHPQAIIVDVAA
ncbi:MAG: type II toxin-antitoxin system HicB family antitoxin [Chloroflexi bacterium]|nr:type II toxin-antitoxin system HicB family antitoxin [Chloroflexota bacterium]